VYNWRILLGGAASAAILTVGIAAPALAQSVSRADTPTSSVSGVTQVLGGSSASGILCNLPGIPMAGPEASAAAGAVGAPCTSAAATQDTSAAATQDTSPIATTNGPASNLSSASSSLPGLNSVSGSIPDLGSAAGLVSGTSTPQTSSLPQVGSVTGASQGTTANNVGSSSSLVPDSSSDSSGATGTTGTTGTTGLGSVTGAVNNLTGSLPGGNSLTTNTAGQGN
jgi:hypothetical protein